MTIHLVTAPKLCGATPSWSKSIVSTVAPTTPPMNRTILETGGVSTDPLLYYEHTTTLLLMVLSRVKLWTH